MATIDNVPGQCFEVLEFKNAYATKGNFQSVSSEMFNTEQEGIDAAKVAKEQGLQVVRMQFKSYQNEPGGPPSYKWKVLEAPKMQEAVSYYLKPKNEALGIALILVATFLILRSIAEEKG